MFVRVDLHPVQVLVIECEDPPSALQALANQDEPAAAACMQCCKVFNSSKMWLHNTAATDKYCSATDQAPHSNQMLAEGKCTGSLPAGNVAGIGRLQNGIVVCRSDQRLLDHRSSYLCYVRIAVPLLSSVGLPNVCTYANITVWSPSKSGMRYAIDTR